MSDTPRTDMEIRQVENLFDSPESIDCKLAIKLAAVEFARQLERENAELKQKAEAAENLLLTIQAWDIDKHELRGHQCLAKQWICSWQDRLDKYKRGKK